MEKFVNPSMRIICTAMIAASFLICAPKAMAFSPSAPAEAQQNEAVKGTVVDQDGNPVSGATILVKGTQTATTTDFNGNFSINADKGQILVISFIGYQGQEIRVAEDKQAKVTLIEDTQYLDDVVVVGYGTQRKATLTGSVAQVNGDEVLKGRATTNVATSLQGAIPGLTITRSSSRPTENPTISIRGGISVNTADPLILIDGVDAYSWELNSLNPNDIENISVLKDAAASIYGARAAGGVILVTTKRAKNGKTTVNYNGSVTANFVGRRYPAATGSEWAQMMLMADQNDTNHNNGASSLWAIMGFTRETYEDVMANKAFDWTNGSITYRIDPLNADQIDAVYGTTFGTSQNLSIQAGTDNIKSITSIGYSNDRSLIKVVYDGQKKYNIRNNTDFLLGKYVKVETGISYDHKNESTPSYGVGYGLQDFYVFPLYTESGDKYYDNFGGNNVLGHLTQSGTDNTYSDMFRLSGKVNIDLSFIHQSLKGLNIYAKGSIRQYNANKKEQHHYVQFYDYYTDEVTNNAQKSSRCKKEELTETNTRALYQLYEFFLTYDRKFADHHVGAMFGNTNELRDNYSTAAYRSSSNAVELNDLNVYDTTTDKIKSSGSYKWSYVSLVGRLNYDFAGRYLIEGTWRHDGSSRLVEKNRWQDFFGVQGGWRLSDEAFMEEADWLSNLKLRASYGQSGSVATIGNYEAYPSVSTGTTVMGGSKVSTSWISGVTDDSRTWETVNTTNAGLDFGFFQNRLSGSFDYFWRKNDGMLINITYPATYGATAPSTNSGTYKTHGWELALKWADRIDKDWSYNIGFTLSDAVTEVTSYQGKTAINWGVNSIVEGKPLNALYVFETDGLLQSQAEVDAYYAAMNGNVSGSLLSNVKNGTSNELTAGCVRRVDRNGDNDITKDDLYFYGDTDPHYCFSVNLGLTWKSLDFTAFFQGVGQQYRVRNGQMGCAFWSGWTNTNGTFLDNTWYAGDTYGYHEANTSATQPLISRNGNRNNWNYKNYNDINVHNDWYVRCKQLQLGYSLPKSILAKAPISKVRVWCAAENLFDISKINDGYDPENLASMGTFSGVDVFAKSVLVGLDLTF